MKFIASLFAALLFSSAALAATPEEDLTRYIAIFSGETRGHNDAVESLAWMGISDPRLYDIIEKRVLEEADKVKLDRNELGRVQRYLRALGFSGQAKYANTIQKYAVEKVYER